ncbi:hypothetical protein QTG54_015577 [Skeletonema marinoi]|uniref:Uncharacterized protein n=1 Tax=Skeletonema marinoi TaxID=267567 RepID=A0AAD9D4R7_9STRA|nr:hypothetical protein QTG54_015577 [Skeletonema marinoi]
MHHIEDLLKKFNINLSKEAHVDNMKADSIESEPNPRPRVRVSFSETSTLNVYENYRDDLHRSNIAYSIQDRDLFNTEATQEADRIKVLIITAPQESRAESIKYLLKNNIVAKEELVGIEHLALDNSNRSEIRKRHSMAVLKKQQEQQQQQQQNQQYPSLRDPTMALGNFARKNSLESRNRARARAALCCEPRRSDTKESAAGNYQSGEYSSSSYGEEITTDQEGE